MKVWMGIAVFLPMAAAFVCYLIGRYHRRARTYFAVVVTGTILFACAYLWAGTASGAQTFLDIPYVCGMGLHFALDGFRCVCGTIAAFMWFVSTVFSVEYFAHYHNRNRYFLFLLLTLGAMEGVFFSADFYTMFLFFEMMSFTSYVWVAQDETETSLRAAATYLGVAVIGGLVMLMGIFLLYDAAGTLYFQELVFAVLQAGAKRYQVIAACVCLFFGFGAKAGAFPLHIWLPKAHPVAPAPASALLSGILTKAGIYGVMILTAYICAGFPVWGGGMLIIGVCTMVFGAVLALFSVNLKRTLACSSVSQIGFILVGIGMSGLLGEEGTLAVRGSMLHMVNHSLIKLVLFLAAGVIFMNVHQMEFDEIRGFGRGKPLLGFLFLSGALGISGVPLFNGYISKTLLHEGIVEYIRLLENGQAKGVFGVGTMRAAEWAFLISGGLTVAYMLKVFICIFVEKNADKVRQKQFDDLGRSYMTPVSAAVLILSAALPPVLGCLVGPVTDRLADRMQGFMGMGPLQAKTAYFSPENLKGAVISIGIGIVVYLVAVRLWMMEKGAARGYVNRWNPYLDLEDCVYRPLLLKALPFVCGVVCRLLDGMVDTAVVFLRKTVYRDSIQPREHWEGTPLTNLYAGIAKIFERIGNRVFSHRKPKNVDYRHKFAMAHEEWTENSMLIARSMSFGLLLFCLGLAVTVIYLFARDIFGI